MPVGGGFYGPTGYHHYGGHYAGYYGYGPHGHHGAYYGGGGSSAGDAGVDLKGLMDALQSDDLMA